MKRRAFLGAIASSLAIVSQVAPQPRAKPWRIGFLWGSSKAAAEESGAARAFAEGMREAGHREQVDYVVEPVYADGRYAQLAELASEIVRKNYDVIVTTGAAATQAVQKSTSTIPVVFAIVNDASGFVKTLARPGGNLTGLTRNTVDISPKHLELLKAVVPTMKHVGFLFNPGNPSHGSVRSALEQAGHGVGITVLGLEARNLADINRAFGRARELRLEAVVVPVDQLFIGYKREIAALALEGRLPTIYALPDDVIAGGLMGYGPVYSEFFRQAARYVDRILKGAKPGDLPVEQPTTFEMVVNLKTAKALGVTIPKSILTRADRVIE